MAERKKYDYEDSRLKAQKFVRYKEGCKLYAMGMSKFQEIAKEAGAIYKINQMVLVNTEILDSYLRWRNKSVAVQLKHDIRGYHAGNISKRYLREAEAADEFELSSNEVIAYATAAGALYRLPRTSLIHRERMETFMKHLYKIPISGKVIEKKYVRLGEASVIYSIGRHRMIEMARAAGAVYKLGDGASGTVLVNLDIFDEYMEQFREMPVMMKHPLFNGKETEE
mgnify:CR=1 FL=1